MKTRIGTESLNEEIIRRKQAEEALQRHDRRLEALNAIATTVGQTLDLDELLNTALDKVLEVMDLDGGAIYFIDTEASEIVLKAHRGLPEGLTSAIERVKVAEADIQRWLEHKEPAFGLQRMLEQTTLAKVRGNLERVEAQYYISTSLWSKDVLRG